MNKETIEKAAREAVHEHCQCYGEYPCEERDYCEFCNGHNAAFDCSEDCDADAFNEGFIAGAHYILDCLCHIPLDEALKTLADYAEQRKEANP